MYVCAGDASARKCQMRVQCMINRQRRMSEGAEHEASWAAVPCG